MNKTYLDKTLNTVDTFNINIPAKNSKYKIISLFSGVGGMDLGFVGGFNYLNKYYEKNPFEIIFANDIFKQAANVYEDNFNHVVEQRSIIDLNLKKDLPNNEVDIVLGGFPCQTFSYAGKRGGLSDPRGQLYKQMIRVLDYYKPKMFIAENVDGIRNSRKNIKGESVDISALDTILSDFDAHGYDVQYHVMTAADYGVPQIRRRVIIMGIRKDIGSVSNQFYPKIICDKDGIITGKKWVDAKTAIDDLWDQINITPIPNHTTRDISKAKFYPGRKMQGNNQISANRPSPTIRAEHHGNIEAHYRTTLPETPQDMAGWRRLSVRECARLQSFPDNFNFTTSASAAYKAIGNAVPPVMAWHIARSVLYTLFKIENIE